MDYRKDRFGRQCLKEAVKSKSTIGFGAVFVKNGKIRGRGHNRRSTAAERKILSHIDYAVHAEQACIIDAIGRGVKVEGGEVYVLGIALAGLNKGTLTIRRKRVFVCKKCPHAFRRYGAIVNIPHINGWMKMSSHEAMATGKKLFGKGYWNNFLKNK